MQVEKKRCSISIRIIHLIRAFASLARKRLSQSTEMATTHSNDETLLESKRRYTRFRKNKELEEIVYHLNRKTAHSFYWLYSFTNFTLTVYSNFILL